MTDSVSGSPAYEALEQDDKYAVDKLATYLAQSGYDISKEPLEKLELDKAHCRERIARLVDRSDTKSGSFMEQLHWLAVDFGKFGTGDADEYPSSYRDEKIEELSALLVTQEAKSKPPATAASPVSGIANGGDATDQGMYSDAARTKRAQLWAAWQENTPNNPSQRGK